MIETGILEKVNIYHSHGHMLPDFGSRYYHITVLYTFDFHTNNLSAPRAIILCGVLLLRVHGGLKNVVREYVEG